MMPAIIQAYSPTRSRSHSNCLALLLLVVLLVVVAGCGSDSNSNSGATDLTDRIDEATELGTNGSSTNESKGSASEDVLSASPESRVVSILFFGDSITAGYGLRQEKLAYPYIFQALALENGLPVNVTSAGNSGETTSGGVRRIDWVMKRNYDIVVIELGGNDGLRGIPVETVEENLQAIVDKVKVRSPESEIVIAGMRLPPSLGASYVSRFESVFGKVAAQNDLDLIPFILDGVAGISALNQADGIHPTAEGHEVIGKMVFRALSDVVSSRLDSKGVEEAIN